VGLGGIEVLLLELGEPREDLARDVERSAQSALFALRLEPGDPRAQRVAARGSPLYSCWRRRAGTRTARGSPGRSSRSAHAVGGVLDLDAAVRLRPPSGRSGPTSPRGSRCAKRAIVSATSVREPPRSIGRHLYT
jgi:hypothetical protein